MSITTPQHDPEHSTPKTTDRQRGAFAVITGLMIFVLLAVAGLAIDMGSWYSQAADMQSAADAAALAGAIEQNETGDPALVRAEVDRVLRANGIDTGDPSVVTNVTIVNGEVGVTLSNTDVELYFAHLVLNDMEIGRTATAFLDSCGSSCVQDVEIPKPFNAIQVTGSGDGWIPILMGDRIYAVNHHIGPGAEVICIDRQTEAMCTGYPMPSGTSPGAADLYTGNIVNHTTWADRIFFTANTATDFGLACWNTATDQSCGFHTAAALPLGVSHHRFARGGGVQLVNDRIFFFDDNNQVHCVQAASFSGCSGYPRALTLAGSGHPGLQGDDGGGFRSSIQHNGRIYTTVPSHSNVVVDKMICWDPSTNSDCAGFGAADGAVDLSQSDMWLGLRLFFRQDPSGNVVGICNQLAVGHECFDLSGNPASQIAGLDAAITQGGGGHRGTPFMYRERTYFNGGFTTSATDCWDWSSRTHCGRLVGNVGGTATADYGYDAEGDCIYALGDHSIFWTFDIDMNVGCNSGTVDTIVYPCICSDGTAHWGQVTITGDLQSVLGPFNEFQVEVFPDGATTAVLAQSMMDTDGVLDLDSIPSSYSFLTVRITVEAKPGQDPWAAGNIPHIEVGWRDQPYLTN